MSLCSVIRGERQRGLVRTGQSDGGSGPRRLCVKGQGCSTTGLCWTLRDASSKADVASKSSFLPRPRRHATTARGRSSLSGRATSASVYRNFQHHVGTKCTGAREGTDMGQSAKADSTGFVEVTGSASQSRINSCVSGAAVRGKAGSALVPTPSATRSAPPHRVSAPFVLSATLTTTRLSLPTESTCVCRALCTLVLSGPLEPHHLEIAGVSRGTRGWTAPPAHQLNANPSSTALRTASFQLNTIA
mmetsp:Transcript_6391/g.12448  ORF Transcript_6391/g.12448 Transcript_6391/m.12448 type:complete len:246 (-) Transcript_6391:168-905(-)